MTKTNLSGVREVVQHIIDQQGSVAPSELVDAARPVSSPAHAAFEWNDRLAGEQWRLNQARQYIRIIRVEIDHQPERLVHVPNVVTGPAVLDREGFYRPISAVVARPTEFARALDETRKKLAAAQAALDELYQASLQHAPQAKSSILTMLTSAKAITDSLSAIH